MAPSPWKLDNPCKELDEHLENAFKRVAGVIGHKMGQDRLNLDALSGSARNILDINAYQNEPFFMRIGRSVGTAASYRPKGTISLKEMAAEVLDEFYKEATGAFHAARVRLHDQAEIWLKNQGMNDDQRKAVLSAADDSLLPPPRDEMTREAMPYVKELISPGTLAIIGGFAGFGLIILTLRHPVLAFLGAVTGAGLSYYLSRKRLSTKAQNLLTRLPQDIYNLLKRTTISNQTRYQDIVNSRN